MLCIIQGGVQDENKFRDNPELFGNKMPKFSAESFIIILKDLHHGTLLLRGENAHEDLGYGEVRAYADFTYRNHSAAESGHALGANELCKVLLQFSGNFQLPCTCGFFHYLILMIK